MAAVETFEELPGTYVYDGLRLSDKMTPAALKAVKDVRFYPEDLLVVTYPKSGTTWVQEMAWLVTHDANIEESYHELRNDRMHFLEMNYPNQPQPEIFKTPKSPPRIMKTHLPTHFLKKQIIDGNPKVIIVKRDLKDTLVSFFNHYNNIKELAHQATDWDMFFELFRKSRLTYGDWGEFYKGWEKYKDNPSFLFLQYEVMKQDPHRAVRMIAKHCDKVLTEAQVDKIVNHTGFEQMKANPQMHNLFIRNFYRKGVVGDWRNYFSTEQLLYVEQYEKEIKL